MSCAASKSKKAEAEKNLDNSQMFTCLSNESGSHRLCYISANVQENNFTPAMFYMLIESKSKDVIFSEKIVRSTVQWESNDVVLVNQLSPRPTPENEKYGYRININTLEKKYFNDKGIPEKTY